MNIAVTGHRPNSLTTPPCWSPDHPMRRAISRELWRALKQVLPTKGGSIDRTEEHVAITGMALGVDQDFARVALSMDLTVHAYIPCAGQDSKWFSDSKKEYARLLEVIEERGGTIYYVSRKPYTTKCMQKRNEAMVGDADHLITVWNRKGWGGTWNCMCYAYQQWYPFAVENHDPLPDVLPTLDRFTHIDPSKLTLE